MLTQENGSATTNTPLNELHPQIIDFGLANLLEPNLTQDGSSLLITTPHYMAPERISRSGSNNSHYRQNVAIDIYSLGVILFELLTGETPFAGDSHLSIFDNVRKLSPKKICEYRKDIPVDLQRICTTCLARNPEARYESAEALAADLRRCAEGLTIRGQPLSQFSKLHYWCSQPARITAAGWFTIYSQIVLMIWVLFSLVFALTDQSRDWNHAMNVSIQALTAIAVIHFPLIWIGRMVSRSNRWAPMLGIILTAVSILFVIYGMTVNPILFASFFANDQPYFVYHTFSMTLTCLILQLLMLCFASVSMYFPSRMREK